MKSVSLRLAGDKNHITKPLPMATSVRAFAVFMQPAQKSVFAYLSSILSRQKSSCGSTWDGL